MTTQKKLMTAEELLMLPDDGLWHELLDGVLVDMSPPGVGHNLVMDNATHFLTTHVRANRLRRVLPGDTGIILRRNPDRVRAPDICFIARDRLPPGRLTAGYLEIVPDLVVEIVSPWDRPREVEAKVREWLAAGARLAWVLNPPARTVAIHRPSAAVRMLTETDTLDGEPVLPSFSVAVVDLFA